MNKPIRILYVEDNPADIRLVKEMLLESPGEFQLETAGRLSEAIKKLSVEEYDIVLIDLGLPDSSGLETYDRAYSAAPRIPFVILSGLSDENIAIQAVKDGAQSYLIKDKINAHFLRDAIRHSIERCKLIEKLKEGERRYRTITDNMTDTVWVMDMDFRTTYISPSVVETRGYTLEELRSMPLDKHLAPASFEAATRAIAEEMTPERLANKNIEISRHMELEFCRKDGTTFWADIIMTLVRDKDGRPKEIIGVGRDITDKKRSEEALKASEEKHRRLFETMAKGVVYQDSDGKIISANPSAERILGLTLDQMTGRTSIDPRWRSIHEDGSDFPGETHPSMVALKTGKEVKNQIMGVYNPSGEEYRWISIDAIPVFRPDDKKPYQVYTTFTDITERQRSRIHIEHLNRLLSSIRTINQLIVKERDKDALLKSVCEILVEVSGYLFVWIGFISKEHKKVIPVAKWGFDDGYLDNITITWDDKKTAKGPTGRAIKTKKACAFKDLMKHPDYAPWKKEAEKRGYRSSIGVPLVYQDNVYGALNVYADSIDYFDEDEVRLLEEVTQDIAYALSYIDEEEKRRQAEIDLRESERKLSTLIGNLPGIAYRCRNDRDWTMEFISDGCFEITGYHPEDFIGNKKASFGALIHPDDRQYVWDGIQKALKENRPFELLYRIATPSGWEKWVWERGVGVSSEGSDQILLEGFISDITDQKIAEKKILYLKQFNENVVNFMVDPIDIIDESYKIVFQNRAAKERFGDGEGKNCYEFYYGINSPCDGCTTTKTICEHEQFIKESILPDGSIFEVHTTPILMPEGYYCSMEVMRDITERKRAEEAIRQSEIKYRIVADNTYNWEMWRSPEGRFLYVSPSCERITGHEAGEFIENPDLMLSLVHPDDRPGVERHLHNEVDKKMPGEVEFRVMGPDGSYRWVHHTCQPVYGDGKYMGTRGSNSDITDKKRAEVVIRESEERYRELFDNISSGVAVYEAVDNGEDFIFRDFNKAAERIEGLKREDVIGWRVTERFPGVEEFGLFEVFQRVWRTGKPEFLPQAFYKDERETGWRENWVYKLPSGEVVSVYDDVTERKQAEEAMRNERQRLHEVLENMPMMVCLLTQDYNVAFANRAFREKFGESEGRHCYEYCFGKKEPCEFCEAFKVFDTEKPHRWELTTPDGATVIDAYDFPFKDIDGSSMILEIDIDITERKRAEQEIRDSEEKWRGLFENSIEAVFTVDLKGNFTTMNDALAEIMGYEREEIIGSNFKKFADPEEIESVFNAYNQLYRTGEPTRDLVYKTIRKDGEARTLEVYLNLIRKGDEITGFQGTLRDVTDRMQAEEALHASETRYRRLFEAAKDGILILDADTGVIMDVNPFIKTILGYSHDELLGKELWEIGTFKDIAANKEVFRQFQEQQYIRYDDLSLQTKDDKEVSVELVSNIYSVNQEKVMQCNIRDITDRKLAEDALRSSEEKYRTILGNINDGYFEVNVKGTFTFFNDSMCKILGYSENEMLGMNNRKYMDETTARDVYRVFNEVFRTKKAKRAFDWELIKKDKDRVYVSTSITPILDKEKNVIGFRGIARDITENKRAEEELRKSEERYRSTLENMMEGCQIIGYDWKYLYVNDVAFKHGRLKREDLLGHTMMEVYPGIEDTKLFATLKECMEKRTSHIMENEFAFPDGTSDWFELSIQPVPEGIFILSVDITERKRAEDALRVSQERFRKISDVVPVTFGMFSPNLQKVLFVSTAFETMYGHPREDFYDDPGLWYEIVHEDDKEGVATKIASTLSQESELEYRIVKPDGDVRWLNVRTFPAKGETGELSMIVWISEDITDKKAIDDALKSSEERYRSLVENINDVIFNMDENGNFTYISPRIADISKYSVEDLMGKPFHSFIHPDDLPLLLESREKTLKGIFEPFEYRVVDKDGTILFIHTSSRPIIKDGKITGITGILTDITEKKKMEEQLLQAEKLSSLGGILSGVAHELNNPLTAIIGNAQILMRRDIPSDIKNKLEVIEKESIRSSKIVGGLLAFARKHKAEKKMIQINDVIVEAYKLREYELRVDNVTINLDLAEDIPLTSADPFQLQQVFINLINNAHSALLEKSGGILDVRSLKSKNRIIIEFEDNGVGIPKEHLRKIFDPFFTTKEVGKGTGLGLSVAYGIIAEHDGVIDVESEVGKGTKFTIEIPIVKETIKKEEKQVEKPMKPFEKVNILVVEDEDSLREFLVEALMAEGYSVEMTNNGEEAIKLLDKKDYDIIISDMKMPGISGQNVYTYVQKKKPKMAEKMLFITGDILGQETQNFLKISGARFIEKPFQLDDLFSLLIELLSGGKSN